MVLIFVPQTSEASRTPSPPRPVPKGRRIRLPPNQVQLCLGTATRSTLAIDISPANRTLQGLIKSNTREDQQEGVRLLSEIFRASPDRRRECLYYLGLGNYKLGNYAEARRYNDSLLELEANNLQAQSLRQLIDAKVAREGLMGVAIVGGLAAAAAVGVGMLVRGAQRKR